MKYSEIDILNFIDGQFNDRQTADFLAALRADPELNASVEVMLASQLPIEKAYRNRTIPPVPESLRRDLDMHQSEYFKSDLNPSNAKSKAVQDRSTPSSRSVNNEIVDQRQSNAHPKSTARISRFSTFALAASLCSGIGVGVLATQFAMHKQSDSSANTIVQTLHISEESKHRRLVKRIADYQSLYVENTVASLSDSRLESAKKLIGTLGYSDTPDIPDFSDFGYEFARAQELGFEGQTLIQLVYRKAGKTPLALCFMPGEQAQAVSLDFAEHHQLNSASWIAGNQHYVLVADEADDVIKQLYDKASVVF